MLSFWQSLRDHVRPADVLDVALIAVLAYFCLIWLTTRASRAVLAAVMSLGAFYAISRWLDLYLTLALFHRIGPTVILIGLVLIFQEDIRRAFEQLASWGRQPPQPEAEIRAKVVGTLVESVSGLAQERIGALIVLRARDDLDRHLRGGILIDGAISVPLLRSIFDPHSPGHDGAVLIDNDRVAKFAVHLPLSENMNALEDGGTRHAAALGLAERSDPLVLVTSEEKGTVSIAQNGGLKRIATESELLERLEAFYRKFYPPRGSRPRWREFVPHPLLAATALCLAVFFWWMFAYRVAPIQQTLDVAIEYRNLPKTWVIERPPSTAQVTLLGTEREFMLLDPTELAFSLDVRKALAAHDPESGPFWLPLTEESLSKLPNGLQVLRIEPPTILVNVSR